MEVRVYLTPPSSQGAATVEERTAVVIDVLRCSTSVCAALAAGARGVIPVRGIDEAVEMWTKLGSDMAVLAGERGGHKIENFQLGNSPLEFTPERVGGKLVVLTTTNGTAALIEGRRAAEVLAGAVVNISAVSQRVAAAGRPLTIICAGREGGFSIEDTIGAGMLIDQLASRHGIEIDADDAGSLALLLFRSSRTSLAQTIAQGEHGRYLRQMGYGADVEAAGQVDSLPVLPVLRDRTLVPCESAGKPEAGGGPARSSTV